MEKLLHFLLGGFICSLITITSILQEGVAGWDTLYFPFLGYAVVFVGILGKEFIINDKKVSWSNILITMSACLCTHLATILGILFNLGSK